VFSPKWTFFRPGLLLILIGLLGYALALPQIRIFNAALDVHTLLIASLAILLGWQCILLATLAQIFAAREGMMPALPKLEKITVEHGIGFGLIMSMVGVTLITTVIFTWWQSDFGKLDYPQTMRLVVPGVTLVAVGFQTAMASLMAGVLRMQRRNHSR
jgi:hypothetical protein